MLKKTITYTDYNGNQAVEDFYFNLTRQEAIMKEVSGEGGSYGKMIQRIVEEEDRAKIFGAFQEIILLTVGEKSEDGKRFIKTQEIRDDFAASPAFEVLFFELGTDADKAAEFINGVMPANVEEIVAQAEKAKSADTPEEKAALLEKDPRDMSKEELMEAYRAKIAKD